MTFHVSEFVAGSEVQDAIANDTFDTVIESLGYTEEYKSGVYVWSRRISPRNKDISTESGFIEWLGQSLAQGLGYVQDDVKHIGQVSVRLGGSGLSASKFESIREIAGNYNLLKDFSSALSEFDYYPTLYVGETDDLGTRIVQHVNGQTDFSNRLLELGYSWEDVGVRVFVLPNSIGTVQRRAIERALAIWLVAPATSRAG